MSGELTVFIVDDDPSVRDALGLLLGVRGYRTAVFASGEDFLKAWRIEWSGCLLIDIRMPGMDGLMLQKKLGELNCCIPIIMITANGDINQARQAFKANASDFIEKPLDDDKLICAIDEAFVREASVLKNMRRREMAAESLEHLTPREREVMELIVAGNHNREIAAVLGISVRTVEVHKARIMAKLRIDNIADLVRISLYLN